MLCPVCLNASLLIGHNRKGRRRWHCLDCNRTFTARDRRPRVGLAAPVAGRLWASLASRANGGR
jgi:transposase-like protein